MRAASFSAPSTDQAATTIAVLVAPADGVAVLREVFRSLQGDFPGAIVILLHPGTGRERGVADNLNVSPGFMISPGLDGVRLRAGHGYVVSPGANLVVGADGRLTRGYGADADDDALLLGDDPGSQARSEGLLASLASRHGARAIAVALTALDADEIEGFRRVREAGGHTVALDETGPPVGRPVGRPRRGRPRRRAALDERARTAPDRRWPAPGARRMNAVLSIEMEILEPALVRVGGGPAGPPPDADPLDLRPSCDGGRGGRRLLRAVLGRRVAVRGIIDLARGSQPHGTTVVVWYQGRSESFQI